MHYNFNLHIDLIKAHAYEDNGNIPSTQLFVCFTIYFNMSAPLSTAIEIK